MGKIYKNAKQILTLQGAHQKNGRNLGAADLGLLEGVSVVCSEEQILWVGDDSKLPLEYSKFQTIDCSNLIMTPELVDCHTHMIFGGDRANEYVRRLNGESYQEIAKEGGGILYTMNETRKSSDQELYQLTKDRIKKHASLGVGTIEIKTGYGLSFDHEYRLSKILSQLRDEFHPKVQILRTFMAAHACPPEFKNSSLYLKDVVFPLMKKLKQEELIDIVDIFHEPGYFSRSETQEFFDEAKKLELSFKSHADEFINDQGARLAAESGALSTDHLLATDGEGIKALASSETVAVMLAGTGFFLVKDQANARGFLDAGAKLAIASDYNPGSCHWSNLLQVASMVAPHQNYRLNQAELWSAITLNAAHALGLRKQGAIVKGLAPRFGFFKAASLDHISYHWGENFSLDILG